MKESEEKIEKRERPFNKLTAMQWLVVKLNLLNKWKWRRKEGSIGISSIKLCCGWIFKQKDSK